METLVLPVAEKGLCRDCAEPAGKLPEALDRKMIRMEYHRPTGVAKISSIICCGTVTSVEPPAAVVDARSVQQEQVSLEPGRYPLIHR